MKLVHHYELYHRRDAARRHREHRSASVPCEDRASVVGPGDHLAVVERKRRKHALAHGTSTGPAPSSYHFSYCLDIVTRKRAPMTDARGIDGRSASIDRSQHDVSSLRQRPRTQRTKRLTHGPIVLVAMLHLHISHRASLAFVVATAFAFRATWHTLGRLEP